MKPCESKFFSPNSKGQPPICLYKPKKERGLQHFLRDFRAFPDGQREIIITQLRAKKKRDGPAANTRSHHNAQQQKRVDTPADKQNIVDLLKRDRTESVTSYEVSFQASFSDDTSDCSHIVTGSCDDGSDERLTSPRVTEAADISGI